MTIATDALITDLERCVAERLTVDPDNTLYHLNMTSYMGERMGPVLERLRAQEEELNAWHAECDKVGVPYDPEGLVRHHRGNGQMIGALNERISAQANATRSANPAVTDRERNATDNIIDDLWSCIASNEVPHLQVETVLYCRWLHEHRYHGDSPDTELRSDV